MSTAQAVSKPPLSKILRLLSVFRYRYHPLSAPSRLTRLGQNYLRHGEASPENFVERKQPAQSKHLCESGRRARAAIKIVSSTKST
jgi:hypothetical protein